MGRHRHAVTVRTDGIVTVLGPLARDPRVRAAALVDVASGMVLDCWGHAGTGDPELVGAAAAELVQVACRMLGAAEPDVVVGLGGSWHHVVRTVPDGGAGPLALSVLVEGSHRAVERVRRRLRDVPTAALCAGPGVTRRPVDGRWALPALASDPGPPGRAPAPRDPARRTVPSLRPAPPAALPPAALPPRPPAP